MADPVQVMPVGTVWVNERGTISVQLPLPGSLLLLDFEALPIPCTQRPHRLEVHHRNLRLAIDLCTGRVQRVRWDVRPAQRQQDSKTQELFRIGGEDLFWIKAAMTCARPRLEGEGEGQGEPIDNEGFLDALDIECRKDDP